MDLRAIVPVRPPACRTGRLKAVRRVLKTNLSLEAERWFERRERAKASYAEAAAAEGSSEAREPVKKRFFVS